MLTYLRKELFLPHLRFFASVSDNKTANASKSPFSAELREEQTNVATADQTTNQAASATPDASETLRKDQESSRGDDHISNSANLLVSEEAASYTGRASEEDNDTIDKKMALLSSETQTSDTRPDSTPTVSPTLSVSNPPPCSNAQLLPAYPSPSQDVGNPPVVLQRTAQPALPP